MTKMSVPEQTEYSFQYEDMETAAPLLSVAEILNSTSKWDKVTICGKVVHMCATEQAG